MVSFQRGPIRIFVAREGLSIARLQGGRFGFLVTNFQIRNRTLHRWSRFLLVLTVAFVLASCGGGGGGSTPSPSPTPPTANAGGPYAADVTAAIAFDGSKSSDPNGLSLSYAWNFGDNTTGTGVKPTHAYTAPGTYNVSLTVTNSNGTASSPAKTTGTITALPTANAGWTVRRKCDCQK